LSISINSLRDDGSRFDPGSSRTNNFGFDAKTLAIATLRLT